MEAKYLVALVIGSMALVASVGCQSMGGKTPAIAKKIDLPDGVPWKADKPPEPGVPARVVATWKDAVMHQSGRSAVRGFGGRLFFYDGKSPKPIPVEGQLVVYAFDETDRKPTDNKPTRRYVFPVEQFMKHQSESELGISYSFWLPWDDTGGPATDVSLIARFEPLEGGSLIVSEQARNRLPGGIHSTPLEGTKVAKQELAPTIQRASHSTAMPPESSPVTEVDSKHQMETTTIRLPRRAASAGAPDSGPWKTEINFPAAEALRH